MEDVSELFKRHFNLLHKGTEVTQTVQDRKQILNNARKAKRDTLNYLRRNINENQSPIITPTPAKKTQKTENADLLQKNMLSTTTRLKTEGVNKRLELLAKWKAEKAKQKEQTKAKAKPIFKVCHVSSDLRTDLENANKVIKGKIVPGLSSKKSQFAPPNHKFKPPKGIKPLSFTPLTAQTKMSGFPSTSSLNKLKCTPPKKTKTEFAPKKLERPGSFKQQPSRSKDVQTPKKSKEQTSKPKNAKFNKDKEDGLIEEVKKKPLDIPKSDNSKIIKSCKTNTDSKKAGTSKPAPRKPTPMCQKTPKKVVGWSVKKNDTTEISSDRKTNNKITYRKTPKKSKASEINRSELETNILNTPLDKITLDEANEESSTEVLNEANIVPQDIHNVPIKSNKDTSKNTSNKDKSLLNCKNDRHSWTVLEKDTAGSASSTSTDYSVDYNNCSSAEPSAALNIDHKTPPPLYVSPFVTISRGKDSARKEYKIRMSEGKCDIDKDTPEVKKLLTAHTSSKDGAAYFKRKLDLEIERISAICKEWEYYLTEPEVPEEACLCINVAIGQSKLLMTKKFQQFRSLILQCETENYELKPVTCKDLHGFWDVIFMQVEDVDKRFDNLQKLKDNGWEEIIPQKVVPVKRTRGRPKKARTQSKLKHLIAEAKKKKEQQTENVVFINGLDYNRILQTPTKEDTVEESGSVKRRSTRVSVLKERKNRCSSSPGLTMMKISQSIKQGDGLTPAKSILKSDLNKSMGKKSVVFKENLVVSPKPLLKVNLFREVDKENVSDNLICFSPLPLTPRRSTRLTSKSKI